MFTLDLNKFCKKDFNAITLTIYFVVMYLDCSQYAYYRPTSVYHRLSVICLSLIHISEPTRPY